MLGMIPTRFMCSNDKEVANASKPREEINLIIYGGRGIISWLYFFHSEYFANSFHGRASWQHLLWKHRKSFKGATRSIMDNVHQIP